jgi:hypothetical protein
LFFTQQDGLEYPRHLPAHARSATMASTRHKRNVLAPFIAGYLRHERIQDERLIASRCRPLGLSVPSRSQAPSGWVRSCSWTPTSATKFETPSSSHPNRKKRLVPTRLSNTNNTPPGSGPPGEESVAAGQFSQTWAAPRVNFEVLQGPVVRLFSVCALTRTRLPRTCG